MKITNTFWFWTLQCIGWGLLNLINTLVKLIARPELNIYYTISEGFIVFALGVFWSTLFYFYLKQHSILETLGLTNILKLIIAFIVVSFLLSSSTSVLIKPIYLYLNNKPAELSWTKLFFNQINFAIYLFLWLLCYRIIKLSLYHKKNKEERLQLEASLKESELNTLKGQINPHFMFNSLNNIRGLMLEDVDKSRDMITRLSEILRYSLTKNKVDTISLREELSMVNNYIELSKIQFEDRLNFQSNIDDKLLDSLIPPMIIQMLIENAVKHGISNIRNGGTVNLSIQEKNKQLVIIVTNPGTLTQTKSSTEVGLKNIKQRIYLLYKDAASFDLVENDNIVSASIKLPL